jgi:hypothetical protein
MLMYHEFPTHDLKHKYMWYVKHNTSCFISETVLNKDAYETENVQVLWDSIISIYLLYMLTHNWPIKVRLYISQFSNGVVQEPNLAYEMGEQHSHTFQMIYNSMNTAVTT